jgi:hypothetical protein
VHYHKASLPILPKRFLTPFPSPAEKGNKDDETYDGIFSNFDNRIALGRCRGQI